MLSNGRITNECHEDVTQVNNFVLSIFSLPVTVKCPENYALNTWGYMETLQCLGCVHVHMLDRS